MRASALPRTSPCLGGIQSAGGGGFGTRPWWLALLARGGAYWPLALEPSAMTSRAPHYCGHPHCRGHPHASGGGGIHSAGGGGFGTRPWWLALLACGGAYWPLALEPSAMTSRPPHYCGHPHCRGHPPAWGGTSAGGGGFGTRPWWLALLACGGAYWPPALEPSAMTSTPPHYCGHPHCRGHPPVWGGSRVQGEGVLAQGLGGWLS